MGTLLAYFIKSACCLVLFYLFYKWLLSKETFHHFNRFVLLSLLFIAAALPLVQVGLYAVTVEPQLGLGGLMMQAETDAKSTPIFRWQWILLLIYLLGIVCYGVKSLISYIGIYRMVHSRSAVALEGSPKAHLILCDKETSPFSWMNYIVMWNADYEANGPAIITHEKAHIHYLHSIDILLADICIMFQWFNPAVWLIKKELQSIHEYEADEAVISQGIDAKNYQLLLIKKAVGPRLYSMANSLNHSSLKKRITMMLKEKSNPWARLKYAYVLPLAAISVAAFASTNVSKPLDGLSTVKVSDLSVYLEQINNKSNEVSVNRAQTANFLAVETLSAEQKMENQNPKNRKKSKAVAKKNSAKEAQKNVKVSKSSQSEDVYDNVEQLPQYPGGTSAMMDFVMTNLKYPKEAAAKKIQGIVMVQFVVGKEGVVRDAKVIQGVPELNAEAIRVTNMMPRWTPGKHDGKNVAVKFTIPMKFKLK